MLNLQRGKNSDVAVTDDLMVSLAEEKWPQEILLALK